MGFLDALTSSIFKTTPEGRKLFFPWGVISKGYVVASETDYQRLQRQIKWYMLVGLGLTLGFDLFNGLFWSLGVTALFLIFYLGWMWHLLPRLQRSHERQSLDESMASKARAYNVGVIWLLTICALGFVIASIVILVVDPRAWLAAVSGIGVFGLCAGYFLRMLVLRRRPS